jgi:hypothetical protein
LIVAGSADQQVITILAFERIIPDIAAQHIVVVAATQDVIAAFTEQLVVSTITKEDIAALTTTEHIVDIPAGQEVIPIETGDRSVNLLPVQRIVVRRPHKLESTRDQLVIRQRCPIGELELLNADWSRQIGRIEAFDVNSITRGTYTHHKRINNDRRLFF